MTSAVRWRTGRKTSRCVVACATHSSWGIISLIFMDLPAQMRPTITRLRRRLPATGVVAGAHPLDVLVVGLAVPALKDVFARLRGDEAFLDSLWGTVSDADAPCTVSPEWHSERKRGGSLRPGTESLRLAAHFASSREPGSASARLVSRRQNGCACVVLAGSHG